ncbi:MAG: ABC-2 type transport system ATP-binding protein [Planctomycetota bacterium]|jgi:ABC-2 type transport system ATP-binding protein
MTALLECQSVTKLYGVVIGVNDLSLELEPGVHGLLGPNGAGKSTLIKLITGQLKPTEGSIRVFGENPWNNPGLLKQIGYCPEHDAFWQFLTGHQFVTTLAGLSGMSSVDATQQAERSLVRVGAKEYMHKPISTYSKGMRQRTKLAQALVHDPRLLVLDEPLSGTDPVGRHELMDLIQELGSEGKSVLVSSHVMHEVQAMTNRFLLIYGGRVLAAGEVQEIRRLLYEIPHKIRIACDEPRALARHLAGQPAVDGVQMDTGELWVTTRKPRELFAMLPGLAAETGVHVHELGSDDESLDAVFAYLVGDGA